MSKFKDIKQHLKKQSINDRREKKKKEKELRLMDWKQRIIEEKQSINN
jgi:hypothetical protein